MAEPVKPKFEYQSPENIKAEVPGAQKIREAQFEKDTGEVLANNGEHSPNNGENSGETSKDYTENLGRVSHTASGSTEVVTRHDRRHIFSEKRNGIHGEPVMLDKQNDKKCKTKIPISRFKQTVEKVKQERREAKKQHESHIPVRRSSIPKRIKENKIPPTKVKKEITITKTLINNDVGEPIVTKTVITKETIDPKTTIKHEETTVTETKIKTETVEDDEFDKIYAEIVTSTPTEEIFDDILLNPKVEDPEKLESNFEEIIHDYDEHKVEPIDVDVVRRSKLPLLKRKSQQEIELSAQAERTSKIIAARDKLRLRHSMNMDDNFEKALDDELMNAQDNSDHISDKKDAYSKAPKGDVKTETEIEHEVITSPNSKTEITKQLTKTVSTSSTSEQENVASSSISEVTTVKEISTNESNETKQNKQHYITETNIMKGSIKVGIPVFDSYVHEYSETNETAKTTEIKKVLSYTSKNEELSLKNNFSEMKSEVIILDMKTNENNDISMLHIKKETGISDIINNIKSKTEIGESNLKRQVSENTDMNVESIKSINVKKTETKNISEPIKVKETNIDKDVQLRVEKIINKIESREVIATEANQRESINELRKKKSVLAKIAMFENKPEESILRKAPKKETKLPKLTTKEWQKVEHVHVHTPLIVDEVFKPFNADIHLCDEGQNDKMSVRNDGVTTVVRAERVTVESSHASKNTAKNKIEIENKTVKEKSTEVISSQTNLEILNGEEKQEVEHEAYTPSLEYELLKSSKSHASFSDGGNEDETLSKNNIATVVRAESVTVESPDTVYYKTENKCQHENKIVQEKVSTVISSQTNVETLYKKSIESTESNRDLFTAQKVETTTITDILPSQESNITNEFASPRPTADKFEYKDTKYKPANTSKLIITKELLDDNDLASPQVNEDKIQFREARNKAPSPTRLSMTKELQAPVIIPGFKPVSQILRSFESKRETNRDFTKRSVSKVEHKTIDTPVKAPVFAEIITDQSQTISTQMSHTDISSEVYDDFETVNDYKSLDDVFSRDNHMKPKSRQGDDFRRAKSLAELDLGDAVKGKVNNMILRMTSVDRIELERREAINKKEMPRKRSVSEKIALFEGKLTPSRSEYPLRIFKAEILTEPRTEQTYSRTPQNITRTELSKHSKMDSKNTVTEKEDNNVVEVLRSDENDSELIQKKIEELKNAKIMYSKVKNMPHIELSNGMIMPVLAVGTALLDPRLTYHIIAAAIDLGYRAIDTAFVYGTERVVGEAIRDKIADGTVKREELFIITKLWSTYHRTDLVEGACRASLDAIGLDYFDLYLIHNPMSFKEGGAAIPKIATVIQYSEHDYLDAWYGMEQLVSKGLARAIGVSNFNSVQLQRVLDKGRVKPVVNQVECHPYLSQQRLDQFCSERNVTLSCYGALGSKGTPPHLKASHAAVIDDPLVQVMASGLGITPAQLLISYQLENGHSVVVKASSARHLYDNLLATRVSLTPGQIDALHALNKNKRMFTFKGMGDTHKNYPFNIAF